MSSKLYKYMLIVNCMLLNYSGQSKNIQFFYVKLNYKAAIVLNLQCNTSNKICFFFFLNDILFLHLLFVNIIALQFNSLYNSFILIVILPQTEKPSFYCLFNQILNTFKLYSNLLLDINQM